jgi:pyrroline-5-carboxylate reductase
MNDRATIGFIGTGNMGGALAKAVFKSGMAGRILLANRTRAKAEKLSAVTGGEVCDNKNVAVLSDYIFLGVEPDGLEEVSDEICSLLQERKDRFVIVSMLAGKTLAMLAEKLGPCPIIRLMPNMPASEGYGMSLYTASPEVTDEEKAYFRCLIAASGMSEETDERTLAFGTCISGCGPAFAAMFVEALADGAVAVGLPRDKALRYAEGMLKGTADMLLSTGEHPGKLKDSVCSPGGSTIQGVRALEAAGFRSAVMNAVIAAFEKKF